MRILIMAGIFPPDIGGPANYIPRLSSAFAEKGHQMTVVCFSDTTSFDDAQKYPFPVHRILRRQNIFKRELQTVLLGIRLAAQSDLIYSNGNDFKSFLVGALTGTPRIHKIVGDTSWERAQNRKWFQGTLDEYQISTKKLFLRCLDWIRALPLRKAAAVITPSFYLKKIITGWSVESKKINVVYNSFQPLVETNIHTEFSKIKNRDLKWMCTICRLVPWKGVDTLIRVLTQFPQLGLVVVGDGPLETELKLLAKNLKVENQIHFAGRQSRESIASYLDEANFFILNSSYEGLPHVVLEAMSRKKLVLASNVGGTPELVTHNKTGILFEYNNEESIKRAISEALETDNKTLIENALTFINHEFSFEKMVQETESIFYSVKTSR